MKLNNKGFAITTIMYIILIFAVILIALTLALLSSRKLILDKIKSEVSDIVNGSYICIPATDETKTTGNVPTVDANGKLIFNIGDEYICEVSPGIKYHFFILSLDSDKVNLIMDSNISINGEAIKSDLSIADAGDDRYHTMWISEDDYINAGGKNNVNHNTYGEMQLGYDKGPVTALKFLKTAVSNLTNIKSSYNVRLPYKSEINALFTDASDMDNFNLTTLPLWTHNYLWNSTDESNKYFVSSKTSITNLREYWLADSKELDTTVTTDDYAAYAVGYDRGWYGYTATYTDAYAGVRFVMSIPKYELTNKNGELVYEPKPEPEPEPEPEPDSSICTLASDSEKTGTEIGAKYLCKVDPNEDAYTFYVLSDGENGTTNLILDRNVYYDEATNTRGLTDSSHDGLVAWNESGENTNGPVTAMDYLENATSTWTNLQKMTINEFDFYNSDGNFVRKQTMQTYSVYARMPYKSEVNGAGCKDYSYRKTCPVWMVDYLYDAEDYQQYPLNNVYGYWTSSANSDISNLAWFVYYYGYVGYYGFVYFDDTYGVRPVINLKL